MPDERIELENVTKRFRKLSGKTYSPDVLDERFRELMRTGLFNLLQIKPTPKAVINIEAGIRTLPFFGFSAGYFF